MDCLPHCRSHVLVNDSSVYRTVSFDARSVANTFRHGRSRPASDDKKSDETIVLRKQERMRAIK
jgi:hypothetical protein